MKNTYLFILAFFLHLPLVAQVLELNDQTKEVWVGHPYLEMIEDSTSELTIDDVTSGRFKSEFQAVSSTNSTTIQNVSSSYWLRFTIKNSLDNHSQWLIEYFDQDINYIEFYERNNDNTWKVIETGNFLKFKSKPLQHKNFEFSLGLGPNEQKTYFIRVKSENHNLLNPVVRSYPTFINYALSEYYLLGIFYGMMFVLAIYNLLFYFAIRERAYIYHIFYIISITLYALSNDGIGFQFHWSTTPSFNHYAHSISLVALEVSALVFSISFLNVKTHSIKVYRISLAFIGLICLRFIVEALLYGFPIKEGVLDMLPLFLAFITAIYFYFKYDYKAARYFILAYVVLFIGFSISLFERIGVIDSSTFTFYSINFASVLEVLFFSFALVHKVRSAIKEKETAQQKLVEELRINEELKEKHNQELEQKVEDRTVELNEQKLLVEQKNQKITSSISYAKNIQNAILPSLNDIKKVFPDTFIYYLPRDIVSGDFYYFAEHQSKQILGVVDCTGHGVPGGFMSMIGYSLLNQIVFTKNIIDTGLILDQLHIGIVEGLRQEHQDISIKDGMDLSLFTIDRSNNMLQFSGANNSIYIIRNEELIELKGDRQPIGDVTTKHEAFSTHSFALEQGDVLYAMSDGFADQFGGDENKKFMKKRLKELLRTKAQNPMDEQCKTIESTFLDWKSGYDQIDDVTILGIRY